jgi:hypothetical protein
VKIAERFGQSPQSVADWSPDWLAVCQTAMAAENGAQAEIARRNERRAKAGQKASGR